MVSYKIIQLVKTAVKNRSEVIFETLSDRLAHCTFEDFITEHPNEYFELFEVTHEEKCLDWTGRGRNKHG